MDGGVLMFWGRMPGLIRGRALAGVFLLANAALYLNILNLFCTNESNIFIFQQPKQTNFYPPLHFVVPAWSSRTSSTYLLFASSLPSPTQN